MDKLVAALPGQHRHLFKASQTAEGAGTWHSLWKAAGSPGAGSTPPAGNGQTPTRLTAGAITLVNPSGANKLYLARFSAAGATAGTVILYDRLWHNSGFSGNITTAQTIATPPTLTRPDADGADVELWGEVYTAMGATASVFTATYTNQDGVAGRAATYSMPANALSVGQMFPFLLQAGDTGVRTVSQVQLSAATGTAGDFGLVLLRRLAEVPITVVNVLADRDAFALGMPEVFPDACLALQVLCTGTVTGNIMAAVEFIEG
jgi:hypothetical protein